jgi:serine/threonine protein kinase/Tol biopolymer transport system component
MFGYNRATLMAITIGQQLGSYEITALLGKGGMGEVYRARDTKLKRDVAIKILPDEFSRDPERVSRFEREAEALAALNHQNIAGIYDLRQGDATRFLILEFVEGDTLQEKLKGGPISVDEALRIATQIAEALEAAHQRGIIHRDLKPANIKLRHDGTVKVLDFGLAKLTESSGAPSAEASTSPTITSPPLMTGVGVLLGTAAYMSPEQARGKTVDARADIWAFGCVLYEMLTGKRAFQGEDIADTLASVLKAEPDWIALPAVTQPPIRTLIRRCLQRDLKRRLPHIGLARLEIEESSSGGPPPPESVQATPTPLWHRAIPLLGTIVLATILTSAVWWIFWPRAAEPAVTRFPIVLPADQPQLLVSGGFQTIAISPDGSRVVYVSTEGLRLRDMRDLAIRVISDQRGATYPVFSPDGKSIVFFSSPDRTLKRINLGGGAAVTLCNAESPLGVSWGSEGILFGQLSKGIMRVPENGGDPQLLVRVEGKQTAYGPQMLPDRDHVLFTLATETTADRWDTADIVVQSIQSGKRTALLHGGSDARYVRSGHLLYALSGVLYAVQFDAQRLQVIGAAAPILEGVMRSMTATLATTGTAAAATQFSVSDTGSLIYVPGPKTFSFQQELVVDRQGATEALKLEPGPYQTPRISPDGKRIAFGTDDGTQAIIWTYDLAGTSPKQRLTYGGKNRFPVWSPDSQWIAFQSDREGNLAIFRQRANGGAAERITKAQSDEVHVPESWSPDGNVLLFNATKDSKVSLMTVTLSDVKTMKVAGMNSTIWPNAVFSPDGQFVAYASQEPGQPRSSLYVEPFPSNGTKYQISDNAHFPTWSRDGTKLFFIDASQRTGVRVGFVAVTVSTRPSFTFSNPVLVRRSFNVIGPGIGRSRTYDVMPDGERFLGVVDAGQPPLEVRSAEIQVVLSWLEELKQRVPVH